MLQFLLEQTLMIKAHKMRHNFPRFLFSRISSPIMWFQSPDYFFGKRRRPFVCVCRIIAIHDIHLCCQRLWCTSTEIAWCHLCDDGNQWRVIRHNYEDCNFYSSSISILRLRPAFGLLDGLCGLHKKRYFLHSNGGANYGSQTNNKTFLCFPCAFNPAKSPSTANDNNNNFTLSQFTTVFGDPTQNQTVFIDCCVCCAALACGRLR